jgi:serine/threonine protein kinase/Tfp pilus assembly protein PilF
MGEENSTPRSNPENSKQGAVAGGVRINPASAAVGGETTLDTDGSAAAVAKAMDRQSIGPYVMVKKLGEGGMGQVWLAEQTAPVKRQVALKLIKGGWCDSEVVQRFEAERQSLAVMNHPTIAKVFDAGTTNDGQPYFVMEYVDGLPITKYCDAKKLKIRQRLELFVKVCEGVQHAHQKAIIHRDLKPSNIMVVEVDGKPVPRIIDFGLAKAISLRPGAEQTLFTQMGGLVGTRGFMSPEQADPGVLDVDTRTDVYSLGVTLYMLLTGTLPFDPEQWKKKPFDEVLRQLREEDPPSPSTKLSEEKETAESSATNRGTEPKQLVAQLRGDLDWITMKAVEKDRARRYGTPSELAADIERYLENRPVAARPASTSYRLKKYAQRHRVGVAATSGAALLLVAFAVTQAVQLRRITRERDRADRITTFMTGMFRVSDPSEARGNSITAREILDKASKDIDSSLTKDPDLQAQMMYVMGVVYESLGLYSRSKPLFERTVAVRRQALGPNHPDTLKSETFLAWDLARSGKQAEAEKLLHHALDTQRRTLGSENRDTASSMYFLGWTLVLEGRYPDAEKLLRETVEIRKRILGAENPDTLGAMNILAAALEDQGHYAQAEELYRKTLEVRRHALGPDHPQTLSSLGNLATVLLRQGHYAEAEKLERETLEARRHVLGPEHPQTLASMGNLAIDLYRQGKYAEAEKLDRETLEIRRRVLGPEQPNTLMAMGNLAAVLQSEGRYAEAEKLHRETLAIDRRVLGPENPQTLGTMFNLATALQYQRKYSDAEKLERETLDIRRRVLGPENPETLASMWALAWVLQQAGRYSEAEKLQRDTLEIQRRVLGAEHPGTLSTMDYLAVTLDKEGRSAEAEKLERDTLAIQSRVLGPDNQDTADTLYHLAGLLAHRGQRDEALSLLREAVGHKLGPGTTSGMLTDPNLNSLHGDPRFQAIVADAKQRVAAMQKPN